MPSVSTTSTTLRQEQRQATRASLALLLATLAWGCSFTWAKAGGEGINETAGLPPGSLLGPLVLLAWRFTLAGLLWLCLFPAARRGWTWRSLGHSGLLGGLLWLGQTLQMLGLDRTSEAVNAFLTSLTVVFVPLIMLCVLRRPPAASMWTAVVLAIFGVWLMTGATPTGFGVGELLGLAMCAGLCHPYDCARQTGTARLSLAAHRGPVFQCWYRLSLCVLVCG